MTADLSLRNSKLTPAAEPEPFRCSYALLYMLTSSSGLFLAAAVFSRRLGVGVEDDEGAASRRQTEPLPGPEVQLPLGSSGDSGWRCRGGSKIRVLPGADKG